MLFMECDAFELVKRVTRVNLGVVETNGPFCREQLFSFSLNVSGGEKWTLGLVNDFRNILQS